MTARTVLITGGGGQLGRELVRQAPSHVRLHVTWRRTPPPASPTAHQLDLADEEATLRLVERVRPDVILHTASGFREETLARDVVAATRSVAAAARVCGAHLVHLSTDLVFDGEHAPYGEEDTPAPIHPYGHAKAEAERLVRALCPGAAVVRTSLITRVSPPDRNSAWVLEKLRAGQPVALFADELRCPIAVEDLAAQLWELVALPPERQRGVWHLVGPEAISRFALGLLLAHRHGLDVSLVRPSSSRAFPHPRPRDVRLRTDRADRLLRTRPRPISVVLGNVMRDA